MTIISHHMHKHLVVVNADARGAWVHSYIYTSKNWPVIEPALPKYVRPGLTDATVESGMKAIIKAANDAVAKESRKTTPIFLNTNADPVVVKRIIKAESEFLIDEANVRHLDFKERAILNWIGHNILELKDHSTKEDVLEIASDALLIANEVSIKEAKKPDVYAVAFSGKLWEKRNETYIRPIVAESMGVESLWANATSCHPTEQGEGRYDQCVAEVAVFTRQAVELFSGHPAMIGAGRGALAVLSSKDEIKRMCETSIGNLRGAAPALAAKQLSDADLERLCLESVYADGILSHTSTRNDTLPGPQVLGASLWPDGRAFLYARAENFPGRVGIRPPNSNVLLFSGDWTTDLDSHRLWGGLFFVVAIGVVLYFVLGRRRRGLIDKFKLWGQPQLTAEDFELENVDQFGIDDEW